jgi:glycogen debranching enzyme
MMLAEAWADIPYEDRRHEIRNLLATGQELPDFLDLVRASDGYGVYASTGPNFQKAVFGRDSLEVAEDMLEEEPELVRQIILVHASLQGVRDNPKNEEQPGKIHHEYRSEKFGDLSDESMRILRDQQQKWDGEGTEDMTYYGTVDATPLYVRLVGKYVQRYGSDILDETYVARENPDIPEQTIVGRTFTVRDSVYFATQWMLERQAESPWNTIEFNRLNKQDGHEVQTWKDSNTSYIHLNGEKANFDAGVASIEMQAFMYDSYKQMAYLFAQTEEERQWWLKKAADVQRDTLEHFWMEDRRFFAQGLDRDPVTGEMRQIRSLTSNVSQLLDSDLLLDLDYDQRQTYVIPVVEQLMSDNFLTAAGIRCRALEHEDLIDHPDYHGTNVTWPKDTFDAANGLYRLGFHEEATILWTSIINPIKLTGEFRELLYVGSRTRLGGPDKVWYDVDEAMAYLAEHFPQHVADKRVVKPEPDQAWVISSGKNILKSKLRPTDSTDDTWSQQFVPVQDVA